MKNYAIYGDEDQEKLLALFAQEDEIQRLVDASNRRLMKDRFKDGKKRKAISDTTRNAVRPDELPDDIKEGKPEKKQNARREKKEKPKKEEKTFNGSAVRKIILIFILLVILLVVLAFRKDIAAGSRIVIDKISQLIAQRSNKDDTPQGGNNTPSGGDVTPQIPISEDSNGYMEPAADKTYTIKEILDVANDSNTALQNYYNTLVEIANESKKSSVAEKIARNKAMVENDMKALESYESAFAEYTSGTTYYNSLHTRFDHLVRLMDQITWVDETKIYPYINQAINEENQYIAQGKSDLINFLDVNDIPYTVNDSSVTYEVQ